MENFYSFDLEFSEQKHYVNAKLQKITNYVSSFIYSNWFFALLVAVIVLSWRFQLPELAFAYVTVTIVLALCFLDDVSPLISCFLVITFIFPVGVKITDYLHLIAFLIPIIGALVYHIIFFRPKKFVLGKLFYPQIAISLALVFGGLGSSLLPSQYAHGLGQILQLGFLLLFLYLFMTNYMSIRKGEQTEYFAKMLIATGLVLTLEMLIFMFCNDKPFLEIKHDEIDLGAISSNGAATVIMLAIPFSFYMMVKHPQKSIFYAILTVLQYFALFITYSRGAILFAVITSPMNIIYTFAVSKNKKHIALSYGIIFAFAALVYFCLMDKINDLILGLFNVRGWGSLEEISSGRMSIFKEAWQCFADFPAFGVGIGYVGINYTPGNSGVFWFHSTFFQVIACTGVFGLLLYLYSYFGRFKIIFTNIKNSPFNAFVLFAFIGFEGYSLINNGTFLAIPLMLIVTTMTFMVEKENAYQKLISGNVYRYNACKTAE